MVRTVLVGILLTTCLVGVALSNVQFGSQATRQVAQGGAQRIAGAARQSYATR